MRAHLCIAAAVLLTLTGCEKEQQKPASTSTSVAVTLPFENQAIAIERVAASLPEQIQAVSFVSSALGVVTTYNGNVYRTTNGGQSWTLQYTTPVSMPLTKVLFTTPTVGYAVGGELSCTGPGCIPPGGLILKTVDGGITWAVVYQDSNWKIVALALSNSGELLAATNGIGGSQLVRSANNGNSWTPVASWPAQLTELAFDGRFWYGATGNGKIIRSADNGVSWADVSSFTYPYVNTLAFNSNIGFCVTGYRSVYKTTDAGITWAPTATSSFSADVVNPLTPTSCLIFGGGRYSGGDFGTVSGSLRQTTDAGSSWTEIELTDVNRVRYTSFYTAHNGYAIAGNALLKIAVK